MGRLGTSNIFLSITVCKPPEILNSNLCVCEKQMCVCVCAEDTDSGLFYESVHTETDRCADIKADRHTDRVCVIGRQSDRWSFGYRLWPER